MSLSKGLKARMLCSAVFHPQDSSNYLVATAKGKGHNQYGNEIWVCHWHI